MSGRAAGPAALSRLPDGNRFVALDSLRGLAALGVVAFHISIQHGGPLFQSAIFANGYLFVDFFFVLSGFVIAASYGGRLAQGFPLGRYMLLRIGRVYPMHVAVIAIYIALELVFLLLHPDGWALREPFTGERSLGRLVQSLLFMQAFVEPPFEMWNAPSWSIAVEVWLYLALAASFRLLPGKGGWAAMPAAAAFVAVALWLGFDGWATPVSWAMARGVLGFGIGVAAWLVFSATRPLIEARARKASATLVELAALGGACLAITAPWLGAANQPVSDVLFALAVGVFAWERGALSRLLRLRPLVWLGVLSYSLFMVQGLVIGRAVDVLRFFGFGGMEMGPEGPLRYIDAPPMLADLFGIVIVLLCLPAAWLAWRYVDNPGRLWSRRLAASRGPSRDEVAVPAI